MTYTEIILFLHDSRMPEMKKTMLIDSTKRSLIELWETCSDPNKSELMSKLVHWTNPFNVKISILIRLGFQRHDGTFESTPSNVYINVYQHYKDNVGENVYAKNNEAIKSKGRNDHMQRAGIESNLEGRARSIDVTYELSTLAAQLNINHDVETDAVEQQSNAGNTDEKSDTGVKTMPSNDNVLLVDDVNYSMSADVPQTTESGSASEFVHLRQTTSALQGYLEQFQLENKQGSVESDSGQPFDATAELLKLLEDTSGTVSEPF